MQSSAEEDLVLAKFEDGEDLFAKIEEMAAKHRIENGMVMWAIGMVRDLEVGYFHGKEYERATFAEPLELLSLHGTFAARADPKLHVHVAAGGRDHRVVGGHVFRGTVSTLNEICIWRLHSTRLDRVLNRRSGLKELTIH